MYLSDSQAIPRPDYYLGLDLGKHTDHTAIAVVRRAAPRWQSLPPDPVLRVEYAERLALGTRYTYVVEHVRELIPRLPGRARVVVDATGVGDPVVEMLAAAGLGCPITQIVITSGEAPHGSGDRWRIPRADLIDGVVRLLENDELRAWNGLRGARLWAGEMAGLRYRHHLRTAATHDDLVIAVALACWRARRKQAGWRDQPLPGIGR